MPQRYLRRLFSSSRLITTISILRTLGQVLHPGHETGVVTPPALPQAAAGGVLVAGNTSPFEEDRLQACFRRVSGRRRSTGPSADHHYIPFLHSQSPLLNPFLSRARGSRARTRPSPLHTDDRGPPASITSRQAFLDCFASLAMTSYLREPRMNRSMAVSNSLNPSSFPSTPGPLKMIRSISPVRVLQAITDAA